MNMLLLDDFEISETQTSISLPLERIIQHLHWQETPYNLIHKNIWIGIKNNWIIKAIIRQVEHNLVNIELLERKEAPAPLPLMLIMTMPRPKALRRTLISAITLGVKHIWLINAEKVEKSYWHTPLLDDANLKKIIFDALEQARDVIFPEIKLAKLFNPFVEDILPDIIHKYPIRLFATPHTENPFPKIEKSPIALAVGPEEGFNDYETKKFCELGFLPISLGKRILRVETAVPALISGVCIANGEM